MEKRGLELFVKRGFWSGRVGRIGCNLFFFFGPGPGGGSRGGFELANESGAERSWEGGDGITREEGRREEKRRVND
jgi:hypothetical protein